MRFEWTISLMRRTLAITVIVCGCLLVGSGLQATTATLPTIILNKAVHFTAPNGDDVVVGPGTFEVEAMKEALQLRPKDGKLEEAKIIQANGKPHPETLQAPKAVTEPLGPDALRLALLLPDGTVFEATGSYSGIRCRDGVITGRVGSFKTW